MRSTRSAIRRSLGGVLAVVLCAGAPAVAEEIPGTYPQTSSRLLTAAELTGVRPDFLATMRNEVFARHGHRFKTAGLANYFAAQPWYSPQVDDAGPLLSDVERKNVALIRQVEKQAKEAQRAKEAAADRAAWDALPADVRVFWTSFRAALDSGDTARVSAFVASDFRDRIGVIRPDGPSQLTGRAAFASNVWRYLPIAVTDRMQRRGPSYDKGVVRFITGDMADDELSQSGRIYRFKGKNGRYQLVGIYPNAGPGDEE